MAITRLWNIYEMELLSGGNYFDGINMLLLDIYNTGESPLGSAV